MEDLTATNRQLQKTLDRLIKKAEENEIIFRRFNELEQKLLSCGSLDQLLQMLLVDCQKHFDVDAVTLLLLDPKQICRDLLPEPCPYLASRQLRFTDNALDLQQLFGESPRPLMGSVETLATGFGQGVGKLFDAPDSRSPGGATGRALRSCILLPLVRNNTVIGSFHLGSKVAVRFTADMASDFMARLASIIAVCLENCINQETLRRLSMVDMLTRVGNRRAFDLNLAAEVSRSGRQGQALSCLFMDIDYFKTINDNHGHLTGDRLLRGVARTTAGQLRRSDHLARYGGEEFSALLPDCDSELAQGIAERIRRRISEYEILSERGAAVHVTVSIGVSTWYSARDNGKIPAREICRALLASADGAVYKAKASGRDRVVYEPLRF